MCAPAASTNRNRMRLQAIYTRFYRSLNHDYLRASSETYEPDPWDATPSGDAYPFVRLRLEPDITTVVGGNESGKSQMLNAIKSALTGSGYNRSDFCRYSPYFGADPEIVLPEFGAVYVDVTDGDVATIEKMTESSDLGKVKKLAVFRMNTAYKLRAYVLVGDKWSAAMNIKTPTLLQELGVPAITVIDSDIPLPDSVPMEYLVTGQPVKAMTRDVIRAVVETVRDNFNWFATKDNVTSSSAEISAALGAVGAQKEDDPKVLKQYQLAADLLFKVAKVEREQIVELQKAVKNQNGYATSLVDNINAKLARALNFPHWWSQDKQFELFVNVLEFDLVLMIRDRTGMSYSFGERSEGLKYFLSYLVQYMAHSPEPGASAEILLMDEPDQFLSSSAQQDLLQIFEDFAHPQDPEKKPVQVVYVTHSPFLIDKNDATRIRVLEKGEYDEGTRVVSSAASNHYEPLRSAFGSFVAETSFISGCNLVVEGASDQIMIAGATRWLKRTKVADRDRLDLNAITIIPSGGTPHVPYMVYLARGRDIEKPAVVVLLDSDEAGNNARVTLNAGVPQVGSSKAKILVDDKFILQIGDSRLSGITTANPNGHVAIEDLVPFNIAVDAAARYCREFVPNVDVHSLNLALTDLFPGGAPNKNSGLLGPLQSAIANKIGDAGFHLDKIAFARCTVEILHGKDDATDGRVTTADDLKVAQANFSLLLSTLARLKRDAERADDVDRISSRINRIKREFIRTKKAAARREDVLDLIEDIEAQLDFTTEGENVRATLGKWRGEFKLDDDPNEPVEDFDALVKAITSLAYEEVRASAAKE